MHLRTTISTHSTHQSNLIRVRIPFPVRIPFLASSAFALLLGVTQMLEGSPFYFALLSVAFVLASTLAFNLAGGFTRVSGGYIFFYAVLAVILGLTYKALLGEPAETNLLAPRTTMLAYLGSASMLAVAAYLARRLTPSRPLLAGISTRIPYGKAAIGCIAISLAIDLWDLLTPVDLQDRENANGSLFSAVHQMDKFLQLGIILGVTHVIRQSHGRRFLNLPLALVILYAMLCHGIVGFSKEGFFIPLFAALIAAAALRYRFSVVQVCTFLLGLIFTLQYVVPLIQQGKGLLDTNSGSHFDIALTLAADLEATRRAANITGVDYNDTDDFLIHYYDRSQGFFDRLQMISIDDALIDATEQGHVFGTYPILFGFLNVIPHVLWKSKPTIGFGNLFAHEIQTAHFSNRGAGDDTTGISFSPTADAFHEARWLGVLLYAPALQFLLFVVLDTLCGDTRREPWGLVMICLCAHFAPEGMLAGTIWLLTYGVFLILLVSLAAAYVLPLLATLLTGTPNRTSPRTHTHRITP